MGSSNDNVLDRCEVETLLQAVYEARGVRPQEVRIGAGSNKGDGYMSFLTRVDVRAEDGQEVHVVMKAAPRVEQFRKATPIREAFVREAVFYEVVMPAFTEFQTRAHSVRQPFNAAAKFYHCSMQEMKEVLVMENIRSKGFELWNRMQFMDHPHIELVLRTYGKFHAVSYAMQQQAPQTYAELVKQMPEDVIRVDNVDPKIFDVFDSALRKLKQLFEGDAAAVRKLDDFHPRDTWTALLANSGSFPVICHGDCWVNNMMFKYSDASDAAKPTDICLLDFQLMRVGSPIMDLSYFFYVSAPKAYLDQLDKYLRIYYGSLCDALAEMQCEVSMSFEELRREWKTFAKYGYSMSLVVSKLMASEGDEILDLVNTPTDCLAGVLEKERKHDDMVNSKLKLLTEHMFENGIL